MNEWALRKRPVSERYSARISSAVGIAHMDRSDAELANYMELIGSLESDSARTLLLGMLAEEIELRVKAMKILAARQRLWR